MTNSIKSTFESTAPTTASPNAPYVCEWADHDTSHLNRIDTHRSPEDIRTVGKAPYGYTSEAYAPHDNPKKRSNGHMLKRFVPHEEDRVAVAQAFDMYLSGHQRTDIARALNAAGFVPPGRRRAPENASATWTEPAVKDVLANPRYTGYRFEKATGSPSEEWVRSQAPTHVALVSVTTYMRARELTLNPPMKRRTRLTVVDSLQGRVNCGLCHRVMARKNDSYVCQPKATGRDSKTHIHAISIAAKSDRLVEAVLDWANSRDVPINISRSMSPAEFNLVMTSERLTVCCNPSEYTVTVAP